MLYQAHAELFEWKGPYRYGGSGDRCWVSPDDRWSMSRPCVDWLLYDRRTQEVYNYDTLEELLSDLDWWYSTWHATRSVEGVL